MIEKIAYAGSFDLFTNGHEWILREAALLTKNVVLVVANNPGKQYLFSLEQRVSIAMSIAKRINKTEQTNIEVVSVDGYVASAMKSMNIEYMIRGIRNITDFEQEKLLQTVNSTILGNIKTFFLMPPENLANISSSFVKALSGPRHWAWYVRNFLPSESWNAWIWKKIWELCPDDIMFPIEPTEECKLGNKTILSGHRFISQIIASYNSPSRSYHNAAHILDMLEFIKEKNQLVSETFWAVILHDVIMQDNNNLTVFGHHDKDISVEEKSAILVENLELTLGKRIIKTSKIKKHILATDYSKKISTKSIVSYADLAILFCDDNIYDDYSRNIRKEYSHYNDVDYAKGRLQILKSLFQTIQDKKLFISEQDIIQRNMTREIEFLKKFFTHKIII